MRRLPFLAAVATAAAALAPVASANADLTRTGGVLGGPLNFELSGDTGKIYVLLVSLTQGPTPLAVVDPLDSRVLSVGLDLVNLASVGFFASPTATVSFGNISNDPGLACLAMHAQFVTTPGATTTVDEISNPVSVVFTPPQTSCFTLSESVVAREGHSVTSLPDGRVLVAGGDPPGAAGGATNSMEIYDPQLMTFSAAGTMTQARSTHTVTTLSDGRLLFLGGFDETETVRATGEIYDPSTGNSSAIAPMSYARTQHTATLLGDGRVLVTGGGSVFDLDDVLGSLSSATAESEIYNPATNSWAAGPDLDLPTIGHAASLLSDGRVLITGGVDVSIVFGIPLPSFPEKCYRYDPGTNSFLSTADLPSDRTYHGQVTLSNGNALIVGGASGNFTLLTFNSLDSCLIYNTASNAWSSAGTLNQARAYPNLLTIDNDTYLLGGLSTIDVSTGTGDPATQVERSTLGGSWTALGDALLPREVGRSAVIDDGDRILTVGTGENGVPAVDKTAEFFAP